MLSREKLLQLKDSIHLVKANCECYLYASRANRLFHLTSDEAAPVDYLLSNDAASIDTASFLREEIADFLEELYKICVIPTPTKPAPELNTLILLVSEACNFACTYCYGSYGEKTSRMSIDTANKAVDLALNLGIRDIVFFGGEPLTNFSVIRQVVAYIEESKTQNITLRMTTNGSLVSEEVASFLRDHNIQVSVSMDGDKESQDLTRIYKNHSSTYQDVVHGINLLKNSNVLSLLEVTYSARHKDLQNQLRSALNLFPVVSCACVDGYLDDCRSDDIITGHRFQDYYKLLLDAESNLNEGECLIGAQELFGKICNGEPLAPPKYLCSDIGSRLVVTPDGRVVPCPEMTDIERYVICNVNSITSPRQFLEMREKVLECLSSDLVEKKWFTGLCETCIQHVKEIDGRFQYVDEASFESCIDSLLVRFIKNQKP